MDIENLCILSIFIILIIGVPVVLLFPKPLIRYGEGSTYGYMTTYESGLFMDFVWIRAEYESSQTDSYWAFKKSNLRPQIDAYIKSKQRVKMNFDKYVNGDVITSIEII